MARFGGIPVEIEQAQAEPQPAPAPVQQAAPRFGGIPADAQPQPASSFGGMAGILAQAAPPVPQGQPQGFIDQAEQWIDQSPFGTIGRDFARGGVGTGDAFMGIAGILSQGKIPEALGYDSSGIRRHINAQDSPEQQAARQQMDQAQGADETLQVLRDHPSLIGHMAIESVPSMVGGGLAGRGAAAGLKAAGVGAGRAGLVGAGAGEGLVGAGQQAEQTRQATGTLTPGQTGLALLSGGLTGLLGTAGARIGARYGVADIDAQLSGAGGVDIAKSLVNRALVGTGIESLEELSQSGQQQVLTNLATDRPALEGVDKQMVVGGVLGAAMGGGASLRSPNMNTPQPAPVPMQQQPSQQPQGMRMPALVPNASPAQPQAPAPQGLHAQVMAAMQNHQPAPAPQTPAAPQPAVPFAKSADISPLLDNLGVQGEQRAQSLDLLRPAEVDIEARRRGVVPLAEQRRLATLIGLEGKPAKEFIYRKPGQAFNAEEIMALNDDVSGRLKSVLEQQQRITSGQASDIQKAEFLQSVTDLQNTFGTLAGARAESGRALAAQRRQALDYRQAQNILEAAGGVQGADALAAALNKAMQSGGVANLSKLIANRKPGLFDYYFRAALLSGVRTHAVNITSNTMTLGNEIIERGIAAGIGGLKRAFTGGKSGETLFAEPLDLLIGSAKGMTKAGSAAYDAFKTGESAMLGVGKQESGIGIRPTQGTVEKAFSLPYRMLGAEDAWFATLNYEGELRTLARHQAIADRKAGTLPPDMKLSQRIEELVQNPTSKMIEDAGDHARTNTFNSKAGAFAQSIMAAKAKHPWLNILAPFVRTPANIVRFGIARTPLELATLAVPSWESDLKAGGKKQERAIARILWGSSVMIGAGALASAGYISGAGPTDEKEKRALLATGWKPYSVRASDGTYYAYNRLDPFAMWMGLASDLATTGYKDKDASKVAARLLGSFVNNTINKTYMQGLSDFSEFLSDPNRNAEWYVRKTSATLSQPFTLLSNIASENDPYARESDNFADAFKYRLPGLRNQIPAKVDQWGEPVPNTHYAGGPLSIANPISSSTETTDPVRLEAGRLGWAPPKQIEQITSNKHKHVLDADQSQELAQVVGTLIRQEASQLIQRKGWAALDDDQKRQALDKIADKARSRARLAYIPFLTRDIRRDIDRLQHEAGVKK